VSDSPAPDAPAPYQSLEQAQGEALRLLAKAQADAKLAQLQRLIAALNDDKSADPLRLKATIEALKRRRNG